MTKRKLGILTVGQSPRNGFTSFNRNALNSFGLNMEVIEAGGLDGLAPDEIKDLECSPNEIGIACYVHVKGSFDYRLGEGWQEPWISREKLIPHLQKGIDTLERAGVDLILLCCAEEYPENAFHSKVPLILPYAVMFSQARMLADTMEKPGIGVLVPSKLHYKQDLATWTSRRWMHDIDLHIAIKKPKEEGWGVSQLKGKKLVAVFYWGYGVGTAPLDPDRRVALLEEELDAPVITPGAASIFFARALLRPILDDPSFVE